MRITHRLCLAAFVAIALTLTGCGELNPFDIQTSPSQPRRPPANVNAADIAFVRSMIDHLERGQVLTSAALAPQADAAADVVRMASNIGEEDRRRITGLSELLDDWGQAGSELPVAEVDDLEGLSGSAFDERWTEMMIEHHERSSLLAEEVQRNGSYRHVVNLASGLLVDVGFEISVLSSR